MLFNGNAVYVLGLKYEVVEDIPWMDMEYEIKDEISWQDAVTHLVTGRKDPITGEVDEKMLPFMVHPTKRIRSASGIYDMAWPIIVRLNYWVKTPSRKVLTLDSHATSAQILKRDRRTCAYCGDRATTADHIFPKSRGGKWTWDNLVAACVRCNQYKADRTPEEAGMKLLWAPYVDNTDKYEDVNQVVERVLAGKFNFNDEGVAVPD